MQLSTVSSHKSVINIVFWLGTFSNVECLECIGAYSIMMEFYNAHSHARVYEWLS